MEMEAIRLRPAAPLRLLLQCLLLIAVLGFVRGVAPAYSFQPSSPEDAVAQAAVFKRLLDAADGGPGAAGVQSAQQGEAQAAAQAELQAAFQSWQAWVAEGGDSDPSTYAGLDRFEFWLATLRQVVAQNLDPGTTYWSKLDPRAALSAEEKAAMLGELDEDEGSPLEQLSRRAGASSRLRRRQQRLRRRPNKVLAKAAAVSCVQGRLRKQLDWRTKGKVTPVKNQGQCGSCYAFAALGAVESQYLIVHNRTWEGYPLALSEQQVVSCGRPGGRGCSGGYSWAVMQWMAEAAGVTTAARYPYAASGARPASFTCNDQIVSEAAQQGLLFPTGPPSPGYRAIPPGSVRRLMRALQSGPVQFAFNVRPSFTHFGVGVYDTTEPECQAPPAGRTAIPVNHAMVLVGFNVKDPANPYWIVKNSWGKGSGDGGYWYVRMYGDGLGLCGMYQRLHQPIVGRRELPPLS